MNRIDRVGHIQRTGKDEDHLTRGRSDHTGQTLAHGLHEPAEVVGGKAGFCGHSNISSFSCSPVVCFVEVKVILEEDKSRPRVS